MHSPTAREIADAFNYSHQCFGPDQDPALALADVASRIGNILAAAGMCDYSSFVDIASRSGLEISAGVCEECGEEEHSTDDCPHLAPYMPGGELW